MEIKWHHYPICICSLFSRRTSALRTLLAIHGSSFRELYRRQAVFKFVYSSSEQTGFSSTNMEQIRHSREAEWSVKC